MGVCTDFQPVRSSLLIDQGGFCKQAFPDRSVDGWVGMEKTNPMGTAGDHHRQSRYRAQTTPKGKGTPMAQPIARPQDTIVDVLFFRPGSDGRRPRPATVTGCSAKGIRFVTSRDYPAKAQVCVRLRTVGTNPIEGSSSALRILTLGQVMQSRLIEEGAMPCYQVDVQYLRY